MKSAYVYPCGAQLYLALRQPAGSYSMTFQPCILKDCTHCRRWKADLAALKIRLRRLDAKDPVHA